MDVSKLKLEPVDFGNASNSRWLSRRILIGFLLFLYFAYALIFAMNIAIPNNLPELPIPTENHLILMMTFGFLGSVFSITRTFVRTGRNNDYSVAWYMTRPLQGVLMALFIYYAFRAGQFVFYSGAGQVEEKAINVYTLSILAIVAGMFTEQAYERIFTIAENLLRPKKIPPEPKEGE